jgi:UDPglucose--hexose-1-phosphate uridylyltransferase
MTTSEQHVVHNPILGQPVVQTPGRMNRREGIATCPFCEDIAAGRWPEGQETWARPNDFPPLHPPIGECYVLLYAREHDLNFVELGIDRVMRVIDLWQSVYQDLSSRYTCVMSFENSGAAIGQTQHHPHGQTYGISFLPPTIAQEMAQVEAIHNATGHCIFCDVMAQELGGERVVVDTPNWVGFIPPYARYPYEVHLYARAHVANLGALPRGGAESADLANALVSIIKAYNVVVDGQMPYMLVIHQLADERFHLHIELLPVGRAPGKLKFAASAESGFGLWLNDAIPEVKATEIRAAIAGK